MVGWIDGVGCCFGFAGAGVVGAAVVGVAVGVDAGAGVSVGAVVAGAAVVGGISRQQSSNTAGQQHDGMVKQKHSNKARKHHSETATQQDSMNPINQQTNFPGKQHTNQLMRPGGMREAIKSVAPLRDVLNASSNSCINSCINLHCMIFSHAEGLHAELCRRSRKPRRVLNPPYLPLAPRIPPVGASSRFFSVFLHFFRMQKFA